MPKKPEKQKLDLKDKTESTKVRKYADFFPDKNSLDKELLEIFFPNKGFQNDSLGFMPLTTSDTIKSALIYFKRNVLDVEKEANKTEQNNINSTDKNKEKSKVSKINLE